MSAQWESVVERALAAGLRAKGVPVPGARLRQLIAQEAAAQGLAFPPDPEQSFAAFLDQYPAKVLVQRRPGSDILVVPADAPEMLTVKGDNAPLPRIREDIFLALTRIPSAAEGLPYYLRSADAMRWFAESSPLPGDAVSAPATTFEQELADRRKFAAEVPMLTNARGACEEALKSSAPLRDFTAAVRTHGLVRLWHSFRIGVLVQRLKAWSDASGVAWQSAWLVDAPPTAAATTPLALPTATTAKEIGELFAALANVMSPDDLPRVSVPLDLVLKALNRKGA